jgi:hypothetical protein
MEEVRFGLTGMDCDGGTWHSIGLTEREWIKLSEVVFWTHWNILM